MTTPKCPKCNSTSFQSTTKDNVINSTNMVTFVHCATCGCVIGVQEPMSLTNALIKLADRFGVKL